MSAINIPDAVKSNDPSRVSIRVTGCGSSSPDLREQRDGKAEESAGKEREKVCSSSRKTSEFFMVNCQKR
eukprot:m.428546 g.428546  ORF g.428546 m.428546 type:complete len:70 (-) comp16870_c0_seq7:4373-4582(-)